MKVQFLILFLLFAVKAIAQNNETYPVDPASEEHAGIPKGEIMKFTFDNSKIVPGTAREVSVYIPAQYKGDKPA